MKKTLIIIVSTLLCIILYCPKQTDAASVYYTFTGPITNVAISPDNYPPWEWFFSEPTYFTSAQFGFIKPQNYGSITHTIEIDMSKDGTWTDSDGKTNYLYIPMDYRLYFYADYISGSLTEYANTNEFLAENNYLYYMEDLGGYLDIYVSYYDKFITLSNWEHHGAPDPGCGLNINQAFFIQGGDWVLLTKISNTNTVPEPTTLFLLAFGLIGVIGLKYKSSKMSS